MLTETKMATWVSSNAPLSQSQMENNAEIIVELLTAKGVNERTIAAILGNMQAESTINPGRHETGGQGYGLIQWTPQSVLIEHASNIGLADYENGSVQVETLLSELGGVNNDWYTTSAFIQPYYDSGATADMVGITADEFLKNEMNWSVDKLAILFMAARLRPAYDPDVNHVSSRTQFSDVWARWMDVNPGGGGGGLPALILYGAASNCIRLRLKNRR